MTGPVKRVTTMLLSVVLADGIVNLIDAFNHGIFVVTLYDLAGVFLVYGIHVIRILVAGVLRLVVNRHVIDFSRDCSNFVHFFLGFRC